MTHYAVDLDGTLAEYHGWKGNDHIGKPVPLMMRRVKNWLDQGHEVTIFTARATDLDAIPYIEAWLLDNDLPKLRITSVKQKEFTQFYDDRAIGIVSNKGHIKGQEPYKSTTQNRKEFAELEAKNLGPFWAPTPDVREQLPSHLYDSPAIASLISAPASDGSVFSSSPQDTGLHYRCSYKGVQLDPARICSTYGITNILQGAIVKKALRAGRGHKDIMGDIDDIITAACRWKEMIEEDNNDS